MKIVIAMDSFKGSMSSLEAGNAVKRGILQQYPYADAEVFPVADGGEGTLAALSFGRNVQKINLKVMGPLNVETEAEYSIIGNTAVIEMSQAAGLPLVPLDLRNPMHTTTFGVGEMIKDAASRGCRDFIIGIGGSATNDAGTGMLSALGYEFLDEDGNRIANGGEGLTKLFRIKNRNVLPELSECHFRIACDVSNPLVGSNGCSHIFAPQKGATEEEIEIMEAAIERFADLTETEISGQKHNRYTEGAGAAGGLGYAFLMYTDAVLMRGIDIVTEYIGIEKEIQQADLVITGEGKIDAQTMMGKTPSGIAKLAKKHKVPVWAFAGIIDESADVCLKSGMFEQMYQLKKEGDDITELMKKEIAEKRLLETVATHLKMTAGDGGERSKK